MTTPHPADGFTPNLSPGTPLEADLFRQANPGRTAILDPVDPRLPTSPTASTPPPRTEATTGISR